MPNPPGTPALGAADVQFNADAQLKLDTAHDILQHPDKFAEIFLKAATSQTAIKNHIQKEIQDSLSTDQISKAALKTLIKEQLKEDWKGFMRSTGGKIAFGVWSIALVVLGAWLGHIWK